ncbi:MAG: hypothetical protein ACK58T_48055, partial [Phycisphaerae bacterium]
ISGLDLSDSTVDLSQVWNDTLQSLYGAELPWAGETVTESDIDVTEDTVQVAETVVDASVAVEEIRNPVPDAMAAEVSDTTVAFTSEFDQWYYTNRDAILAEWSKVFSSVDLNDPTVDLTQIWNDTLRNLYGAELPYDDQTVTEDGGVVTEDTVRVDETVSDASVAEEVTTSGSDAVAAEVSDTTVAFTSDFDQWY